MAERRPPGFTVDLEFYDGPQVESIPRRIRAAAIGVWTLCGSYSANKLADGYVGPEMLKNLGCTDAIRAALKATRGHDGEPDPLWIDARDGGIQFTRWAKWQRTRDEVKAYREADAERKRLAREAKRNPPTSNDPETSERTPNGLCAESRDPKTKSESKSLDSGYEGSNATDPMGRGSIAATPGADLVREHIEGHHPKPTLTSLRIQASELINTGTDRDIVAAALQLWNAKPGIGIGRTILASLCSEVIKTRAVPAINGFGVKLPASDAAFAAAQALKTPEPTNRLELE